MVCLVQEAVRVQLSDRRRRSRRRVHQQQQGLQQPRDEQKVEFVLFSMLSSQLQGHSFPGSLCAESRPMCSQISVLLVSSVHHM